MIGYQNNITAKQEALGLINIQQGKLLNYIII